MIENIMTNEQKLDEIYQIIKAQESRTTRAKWFRLLKWIIFLGLAYFIAKNPGLFLDKITELVMPTIIENMKTMMTEDLMKQVQDAFQKQ